MFFPALANTLKKDLLIPVHEIDGRDGRETATPPAEECEVILHLRTPSLNAVITLAGFLIICCNEGLPSLVTDRLFPR